MIRLSKLTDYAVIVLGYLGAQAGKPASAYQIAKETRLPEPTVQKVLKLMAARKLVTAQRGANGGYLLPLSLECLSVYDIVYAIEGPLELSPCLHDGHNDCELSRLFAPKQRWNKVNLAIKDTLSKIRIADLVKVNT